MELHSISFVQAMSDGSFLVTTELTDSDELRDTVEYVSRESDAYGLAPVIWAAVQQWISDGKTVEPYNPVPTLTEFQSAIQAHVDASAVSKLYNDGNALAGYVNSTVPQWAAEAQAFVTWRDVVWVYAYAELGKVQNGQRQVPAVEAFIGELPALVWPE
ncbi:hypothetical protein ASD64_07050 [Mesorhizobium sp. Root157]|uniref:hypothetical protein n=1 Tax=Mesorhizobium sp. Root157 TaxID=1736477 RepID=UPI0006F60C0E|nr:hypothetical protein [Mesorhizobium sp. Root157]KQZ87192.1 hypothetical protein ASD64_07050 [Mesorhizobium sp. Root157]